MKLGIGGGGGVLTLTWYTYICVCPLGYSFVKFGIAIRGFSSETKEPKVHKLGVFGANYCKKHPILTKLGAFLLKMVYWWVGNWGKNWYRESQIFEVRQAHPYTILVKVAPRVGISAIFFFFFCMLWKVMKFSLQCICPLFNQTFHVKTMALYDSHFCKCHKKSIIDKKILQNWACICNAARAILS